MTTKAAAANGIRDDEVKYLPLLDKYLAEIKTIQKGIARKRKAGRKTVARIDRNLKEIQTIIDRVEATL
jgi:hypothetical protein